ncbi:NAD(P)H-hydrate dehydratase [Patescibacteria group bacterium]|nr:NAD(P)H-hydrate dehydratase [Patescibacteria group bacterium]
MSDFDTSDLKKLYVAFPSSHKGQNGKLLIIGGSKLFHAASLWSLKVASRIVDMVFYSSVPENNQIVQKAKEEFRDGIIVKRDQVESYVNEADCVLIGPGLPRKEGQETGDDDTKKLTEKLVKKYPKKKWVIDGGSLQTIEPEIIPKNSVLTPHQGEFEKLFGVKPTSDSVLEEAEKHSIVILVKGQVDIVCSPDKCITIKGGNAGMTKGGTGDVLAGLVAALYCKNEAFLSACAGSYINKKAGESLFRKVGYYFNSSDLIDEIPKVMNELIIKK